MGPSVVDTVAAFSFFAAARSFASASFRKDLANNRSCWSCSDWVIFASQAVVYRGLLFLTTDPDATYATKGGTPARLGYYDNYHSSVIVGVQATAAPMRQETVAAQNMLPSSIRRMRFGRSVLKAHSIDSGERCPHRSIRHS